MTISEIAKAAGVSIGTVDRVIHNRGRVAPATKEKIENLILQNGYRPNALAHQLKCKSELKIGALFPSLDSGSGYWQQLYSGMQLAVEQLSPFSIKLYFSAFNRNIPHSVIDQGLELLNQGINALVMAPVVPDECVELIEQLGDIPYIYVDSPLTRGAPLSTIAQNPYQGGQCAGRIMKMLKGNGEFACMRMFANAYNLRERCRGFTDFLSADSACTVIDAICPEQDEESLFPFLDELFALHTNLKGIFVAHAEVHLVGRYLIEHDLKHKVALIGYDLLPINKQALFDGYIDSIISQRPEHQGLSAVYEFYKSELLHQNKRQEIKIPIDIFFKENIV